MFQLLDAAQTQADRMHDLDQWPRDHRLLLDVDELQQARWGWVSAKAPSMLRVMPDASAFLQVLMSLDQCLPTPVPQP